MGAVSPARAAVAHVQTSTEVIVTAGTSGGVTVTGVGPANHLAVLLGQTTTSDRTFSTSDDKGNTWVQAVRIRSTNGNIAEIEHAQNTATGDTLVTVTVGGGLSSTFRFFVHETSGVSTSASLDQTSSLDETVATNNHLSSADATVIDTAADVIVYTASVMNAAHTATSPGTGYTEIDSASEQAYFQYRVSASALTDERGAWSGTGTARTAGNTIASFKGDAAGAATPKRLPLLGIGEDQD